MTNKWDDIKTNFVKLKGLTTIGFATVIASAVSALFWFYVATLLGAESYGKISYFIAIASMAGSISFLGMGNAVMVYATKEKQVLPAIYFITVISGLIASIVVFFILYNIGVSVYVIGLTMFGLATSELLGMKLYKKYSKYLISQSILLVVLAIGLYYVMGENGVILGCGLSYFPVSIMIYNTFKGAKINPSLIKPRLTFIANNYLLSLSKSFSASFDKLIIFPLFGFAILGNYQLGLQFFALLNILPAVVLKYTLPREASGMSNKRLEKLVILTSLFLAISGIFMAPILLPNLLPEFKEAVNIIPIMALSIIPRTVSITVLSKFLANEKSKIPLIGSGIFILVQVPAILLLGSLYDIYGVAMAFVLAMAAECMFLIIMKMTLKEKTD